MTEGTPAAELAKLRDEFTTPIEIGGQLYWHDLSDVEQVKDHLVNRVCTDLRLGAGGPPKELSKDQIAKRLGWLKLLGECNDAVVSSAAYWVLHADMAEWTARIQYKDQLVKRLQAQPPHRQSVV